jgi:hypothetical protein
MLASTTYIGETGRILSSSVIKLASSSTSRITSSTSPSDTSQATTVTTNQSESSNVTAKSAVQTGAIVGGVLGGLAVVGFFALAALFILKKYGKRPGNGSPLGTKVNDEVDGPSGPIEMAATWRVASPAQPHQIRHSNVFAYQTQYQPVVAEMPADEHTYEEKKKKMMEQSNPLEVPSSSEHPGSASSITDPLPVTKSHSVGQSEPGHHP